MTLVLTIQKDKSLRQLNLDKHALATISDTLTQQADSYLKDVEFHDYSPGFKPEAGGLLRVNFTLPTSLQKCGASTPSSLAQLKPDALIQDPPAALVAVEQDAKPRFIFQAVDSRVLLRKGRVILFNPGSLSVNAAPGLVVRNQIDAVHVGGKLYFASEFVVKRFLDIDYLFREATDDEIDELFSGNAFKVDDWDELKSSANSLLRRKLHVIATSGKAIVPKAVKALAERIGESVEIRKNALVVPTEPAAFREFVRMLANDYLESPLDHELWLTTSKRPAKKKASG